MYVIWTVAALTGSNLLSWLLSLQAGETRRKHEIHDFIEWGLAVAESERAKATLVSHCPPPPLCALLCSKAEADICCINAVCTSSLHECTLLSAKLHKFAVHPIDKLRMSLCFTSYSSAYTMAGSYIALQLVSKPLISIADYTGSNMHGCCRGRSYKKKPHRQLLLLMLPSWQF